MTDINRVVLVGRLTRDAELRYTNSGTAVSRIGIAVNRSRKNGDNWEDEVSFFDVVLWGRAAESLNSYLQKGKQIAVDGELRQNRWEQEGQNRSKVEVVANSVQLLGGNTGGGNNSSGSQGSGFQQNRSQPSGGPSAPQNTSQDDFEDDIPF